MGVADGETFVRRLAPFLTPGAAPVAQDRRPRLSPSGDTRTAAAVCCRCAARRARPSYDRARNVLASAQSPAILSAPTTIEDAVFPVGPTGKVNVRIVRPAGAKGALPVVMYFHGGGWVMGDPNTHDHLIREIAAGTKAAVVFVHYDRPPEVKYPTNTEQAYAATQYVVENAKTLNVDASRLAVAGDSAGGNMAAMIRLSGAAWNFRRPQINSVSLSSSVFVLILTALLNSMRMGALMRPSRPADRTT